MVLSTAVPHPGALISWRGGGAVSHSKASYFIGLSLLPGIGPIRLRKLIDLCGSPAEAYRASADRLRAVGVEEKHIPDIESRRASIELTRETDRVARLGARVITCDDPEYPVRLRETYNCPAMLYVLGELQQGDAQALAVVGTRRPSVYGQALTAKITPRLVEQGLTVVSGLALGIDTIAHKEALAGGGRTIAVLGSGLDVIYPSVNRGLAKKIATQGAVVTEYAMGTQPDAFNFPMRNRIVSGLSLGALIVEAGERSGALLTAKYALDQNREVFAFPGRVTDESSAGCNRLIKQGRAKLVTSPEDIFDELELVVSPRQTTFETPTVGESEVEAKVLEALSQEAVHVDTIGRTAGISAQEVVSTLTLLELRGVVRHVGAMHYIAVR
jgi:DNA processing protein